VIVCVALFVFGEPLPYGIKFDRGDEESRQNDRDTSTRLVGNNQRVHKFQERVAHQILHVTADSNQSNESNIRARRIACACWPALVGYIKRANLRLSHS